MDKREMLDRLAANGDERLLLGRVWDKYEQCRRRNLPEGTGFLSPAEQAAAQRLLNALDEVISEKLDPAHHIDAVERKLFGIGAESYTVGSTEFYMGYATSRQTAL